MTNDWNYMKEWERIPVPPPTIDDRLLHHYQKVIDMEMKIQLLEKANRDLTEERIQKRCKVMLLVQQITGLFSQLCRELVKL
jgi:hypothetical protein